MNSSPRYNAKVVLSIITLVSMVLPAVFFAGQNEAQAIFTSPTTNTFCDNFEQSNPPDGEYELGNPPPAEWIPLAGTWAIADNAGNHVLHQTDALAADPNDPVLLLDSSPIGDAVIYTRFKALAGDLNVGVVFRAEDHDNFYLFRINAASGTAGFFKRQGGIYSLIGADMPFAIVADTWYTLRVDSVGEDFRAFIASDDDENFTFLANASDGTFTEGKLGLRTHLTESYFDETCFTLGSAPFTWDVDDDGAECPDANFNAIQPAIDFVLVNDTVHVCAGTYEEQLVITKQIKLTGEGLTSIIKLPPIRPSDPLKTITVAGSPWEADPLIWIEGEKSITVEKFMLDGSNNNDLSGLRATIGVVTKNASATLQNVTLTNFNGPACWGCSTGYGVWVEGTASSAQIQNNILSNIQADYVTVQSGKATLITNTFTGLDAGSYDGQAGVSFETGASGLMLNNTLSGFNHPGAEISSAISMVNAASGITLSGNKLNGNERGIFVSGTNGGRLLSSEITGSKTVDVLLQNASNWMLSKNKLTGSLGQGLVLSNVSSSQLNTNTITASALEGVVLQTTGGGVTSNNVFVQNTVSGTGDDGILLTMDGLAGNAMNNNIFTSNTVRDGLGNGINFEAVGTNRITRTSLKANKLLDNLLSGLNVRKSTNAIIDANTITGNKQNGVVLADLVNGSSVSKNNIRNNTQHGIALLGNSDNNSFKFNTTKTNGVPGFFDLYWDQDVQATGNSATFNFYNTRNPITFWK